MKGRLSRILAITARAREDLRATGVQTGLFEFREGRIRRTRILNKVMIP